MMLVFSFFYLSTLFSFNFAQSCTSYNDCNLRGFCQSGKCVCYNTNNYWPSDSCSIYHDGPQLYDGQVCNPGLVNGHCSWVGTCNAQGTACVCNDGYHRYPSERCAIYHADAQPNPTVQPTLSSGPLPTVTPTQVTAAPSRSPTTAVVTSAPTQVTANPSRSPTIAATPLPTQTPVNPTAGPTIATSNPTLTPTVISATNNPTVITSNPTRSPTQVTVNPTSSPTLLPPSFAPSINPTVGATTSTPTKAPTVAVVGCVGDADCNLRGFCQSGKCVCYNTNNYWPSDSCSIYHDGPQLYDGQVCNPGLVNGHCSWVGTCNAQGTACVCNDGYHRYPSERCAIYHADAQPNPTVQPTLGAPVPAPTVSPTATPTSSSPTRSPTLAPSQSPTLLPTPAPTRVPTLPIPTADPTTATPTFAPSNIPTVSPTTFKPTISPTTASPTTASTWATLTGYTFNAGTVYSTQTNTILDCQNMCVVGCDFYTYQSNSRVCNIKYTDKAAYTGMIFTNQLSGYLFGYLRNGGINALSTSTTTTNAACKLLCTQNPNCHFVSFDFRTANAIACTLYSFPADGQTTIGYRVNVPDPNYSPTTLGRFDRIGNSGVVTIHTNLLPNGKLLCTARPEYQRGSPNYDNLSPDPVRASKVTYGEISSVFDPATGTSFPVPIDDNIFCHGSILAEDGRIFTAGGDNGGDMGRDASAGFTNGLRNLRYFDPATNVWSLLSVQLQVTRWYPTVVRTPTGTFWIIGGLADGAGGGVQMSIERWIPGTTYTTLLSISVLTQTGTVGYPFATLIPQTNNIFLFAYNRFSVFDATTGAEVETPDPNNFVHGVRSGDYPGGYCLLPMKEDANGFVKAEGIFFGGTEAPNSNETSIRDVARIVLTNPVGQKIFTYDSDSMPYGRVVSDCVLYPNGYALIFNGARLGRTGGSIGAPLMFAAANDVFAYNPEAPAGQKFTIFAATGMQRFYHSVANLIPDGRVLVSGTDEATYVPGPTAYSHDVEAFTPPWLLDGSTRPVINSVPTGVISYGQTFTISYSGPVNKVALMTPQATTHGTEMTQRLYFATIVSQTTTEIVVRAPKDATILLQGYHMVFLVNDKTPSIAKWIRLGN